jgi:hypothetical protein
MELGTACSCLGKDRGLQWMELGTASSCRCLGGWRRSDPVSPSLRLVRYREWRDPVRDPEVHRGR